MAEVKIGNTMVGDGHARRVPGRHRRLRARGKNLLISCEVLK